MTDLFPRQYLEIWGYLLIVINHWTQPGIQAYDVDLGFVNRWTDARGWDMNCDPLKLSGELHSFFLSQTFYSSMTSRSEVRIRNAALHCLAQLQRPSQTFLRSVQFDLVDCKCTGLRRNRNNTTCICHEKKNRNCWYSIQIALSELIPLGQVRTEPSKSNEFTQALGKIHI